RAAGEVDRVRALHPGPRRQRRPRPERARPGGRPGLGRSRSRAPRLGAGGPGAPAAALHLRRRARGSAPVLDALNSGATVIAHCPICGREPSIEHARGPDFEYASTGDTEWTFRRCPTCDVVSLSPRPDESALSVIYPSNYYAYDFDATPSIGYRVKEWLDR